ncbi:MAG: ATP-binding protein [Bacteroidales bacterium]|nr:ATP-binding protein [Bacteroidales bacterium]
MDEPIRTNTVLNILSLEDSILDYELIRHRLIDTGLPLNICRVDKESDFVSSLRNNQYDIILADFNLPGFDAFKALKLANEICPEVPYICVSGSIGEEKAIELLKLGAVDYVIKDRPERLPFSIKRALDERKEKETRKMAEKALLQSEENFRHSISESPLGIRISNIEGKTIYANKAFLDIYEFSNLEEFTNTPAKNRYTPESYLQHLERKNLRSNGKDVFDYELSIVRKNAEIRHIKISRKEVLWNGVKHFQIINQDITEQKKLTIELIAAKEQAEESDRLKTAFLANVSHEIRTPMNGILGFAGLLKEPHLTDENQQSYINIIEKSGERMLNIINDIVDISKIESRQMNVSISDTDVNELIDFIYSFFKPEVMQKGLLISIKKGLPDKKALIKTDREKVYAILTNLVKNAIKFTQVGSIEVGYYLNTKGLEFSVKDTGIGISQDQKKIIFERFRQGSEMLSRNYEGAGLGLSISKAYVEMLGGEIWVESVLGKGSTFYFTIPENPDSE